VRRDFNDLNQQHLVGKPVDHAPLKPKPRRAMAFPFTRQRLVMKPLDRASTVAAWVAKALRRRLPQTLLLRADEVIP
jgi:hypothetical protein